MQIAHDLRVRKKTANLTANADLLIEAKKMDINLSAVFEQALANAVRQKQGELWLAENQRAIQAYNEHVAQHGVFSDGLRDF